LPGRAGGFRLGQQGAAPLAGQRGMDVMIDHYGFAPAK
jgi:hypothetical protein